MLPFASKFAVRQRRLDRPVSPHDHRTSARHSPPPPPPPAPSSPPRNGRPPVRPPASLLAPSPKAWPEPRRSPTDADTAQPHDEQPMAAAYDAASERPLQLSPRLHRSAQSGAQAGKLARRAAVRGGSVLVPSQPMLGPTELGHALSYVYADSLSVFSTMGGRPASMLPSAHHGHVGTQARLDGLLRASGRERDAFTRDMTDHATRWTEQVLSPDLRRLGTRFDWSRRVFTMSDHYSLTVGAAFLRLHDQGLIFRATRLVNWSCALRTIISQSDVDYIQIHQPTALTVPGHTEPVPFGLIYAVFYPLAPQDPSDSAVVLGDDSAVAGLVVWTTRPETLLADVAVAVHSTDARYSSLHGRSVVHPLFPDRRLPIIVDDTLADPKFGSGVAQVAPGHNPKDFECAQRHGLPVLSVFSDIGCIGHDAGRYEGLPRYLARRCVLRDLQRSKLLRGEQPHKMTLALCAHSGDVIELVQRDAWWMHCEELAGRVNEAVNSGELRMIPSDYKPVMNAWMTSVRPWCISRPLAWGHRIPAYRITVNGQPLHAQPTAPDWIVASDEQAALRIALQRTAGQHAPETVGVLQDTDVLDSWFSSALNPLAAPASPEDENVDAGDALPYSMVVAPHDLLFYWVARMAMLSLALTNKLPFKEVLLHPLVRDKSGRKMSAQLGNVLYPHDVIHGQSAEVLQTRIRESRLSEADKETAMAEVEHGIPAYGADALRMGMLASQARTNDVHFDLRRINGYRHFIAEMWQLARFAFEHFEAAGFHRSTEHPRWPHTDVDKLSLPERWVLSCLTAAVGNTHRAMQDFNFSAATNAVYEFCLHQLGGTFVDLVKPCILSAPVDPPRHVAGVSSLSESCLSTLFVCLHTALRLLHPFAPLVTDQLYRRLCRYGALQVGDHSRVPSSERPSAEDSVASSPYPTPHVHWRDTEVEHDMQAVLAVARASSWVRSEAGLSDETRPDLLVSCTKPYYHTLACNRQLIATLGRLNDVTVQAAGEDSADADALCTTQPASTPSPPSQQLCYLEVPKQSHYLALSDDIKLRFDYQPSALDADGDADADAAAMSATCQAEERLCEAEAQVASIRVLMDQPRYLQAPHAQKEQWLHELRRQQTLQADLVQQVRDALQEMDADQLRRYATFRAARFDRSIAKAEADVERFDRQVEQQRKTQRELPSTAPPASTVGQPEIALDSVKRGRLVAKLKGLRDRQVTAAAKTADPSALMDVSG